MFIIITSNISHHYIHCVGGIVNTHILFFDADD